MVKKVVEFAAARDLYLLADCDEAALLTLHAHHARPRSSGPIPVSRTPARLRQLLETYPALMGELSYRGGITEAGGKLATDCASCSRAISTVSS